MPKSLPGGPLIAALVILLSVSTGATHLKSVQVIVKRQFPCSQLTFDISVRFYVNNNPAETSVHAGNGILNFGDGEQLMLPEIQAANRPDLGPFIGVGDFTVTHTFQSNGVYKISYTELNRNAGIINLGNSALIPYSTSTTIDTSFDCNSYPELLTAPVDRSCSGATFFHSPGAIDADGDSLHFEFVVPLQGIDQPIPSYKDPVDPSFYPDFLHGSEDGLNPPSLSIDPNTGLTSWNAPGMPGQYTMAFKIEEWRIDRTTGETFLISTTIRDMLIVVENCPNNRPDLIIPENLCVVAGTVIDEVILGVDADLDSVKIEFFSDVFALPVSPPTLSPSSVAFRSSDPADTVHFHWQTDCIHIRDQPYQIVIKITDKHPSSPSLVTYKTWEIKVIAPAPVWKDVSLDLINRKSVLTWEPYSCSNAEIIQVWRKVGHFDLTLDSCKTGLSRYLGYELIAKLLKGDTIFVDNNSTKGLVDGALYCYRLVAVFPLPGGERSYVTSEMCVGPIRADAPVITNVSVEDTNSKLGSIRVSWRSPFDIDQVLFPKPYQYEVYRGKGFSSGNDLVKVALVNDTTFLNSNLNTSDSVFNYRIVVYSKPAGYSDYIPVDTSATASSVRLLGVSGDGKIELGWEADVPWSNVISGSSFHNVFRGSQKDTILNFIARANVTDIGFSFTDTDVESNQYYCYTIMTRGTYGNDKIDTLRNFSQRLCLYPKNDLNPCPPTLQVARTNCDDFIQQANCDLTFRNMLSWENNIEPGCREDVVSYNLYSASDADSLVLVQAGILNTDFIDTPLPSYARCYAVTAIDARGEESQPSEISCNDNCPVFELPNVFTPGRLDGCNDTFRVFNGIPDIEGECDSSTNCLLFIEFVSFSVYNRWGEVVFSNSTEQGLPPTIEWNGQSSEGKNLEGGIYFYKADVQFDVVNESEKNKIIKGWVHLVR